MSNYIENSWIDIKSACGGSFGAYVSLPPAGFGPGLLVIQEIFGVNDHIKNVCDQYALDGFVAVAPDVFWRQEPQIELSYDSAAIAKGVRLFDGLNIDIAAADLQRAVEAIRHIPSCTGKVGAIGFCMGGLLAFVSAARAGVESSVIYYGTRLDHYLDLVHDITCPLLFHFASDDKHISTQAVKKVKMSLTGKDNCRVIVHKNSGHGFNCWHRDSWNQSAAATARGQSLVHLMETLS
ncbi:dienelactone hydrolase family protein [Betaproteobacteria bacterium]|nr:dienelactone hydrolase family protein [Betaproteobacteria bacterium]